MVQFKSKPDGYGALDSSISACLNFERGIAVRGGQAATHITSPDVHPDRTLDIAKIEIDIQNVRTARYRFDFGIRKDSKGSLIEDVGMQHD
jgi:hypothetical protein